MRSLPSRHPLRVAVLTLIAVFTSATALGAPATGSAAEQPPRTAAGEVIGGPAMATTGTVSSAGTRALPTGLTAAGFVVADLDTGAVYAARNPHVLAPPASTIKTLTALVLLPKLNPAQVVVANAADANVDGTRVGIVRGGKYTVEQLFQAMLMMSGNDAAELLARAAGGRSRTLAEMNARLAELQAFDTYAGTPSGLDAPGQVSSPYDLALINRATMAMPAFRRYVAMRTSTFGAAGGAHFAIQNHNRLFRDNYPGAIGIKNGYTEVAQHTYVGAASRAGRTYLVSMVRVNRTYPKQAEALLDWAFALPPGSEPIGQLVDPVAPGEPAPSASAAPAANSAGTAALTNSGGWQSQRGLLLALAGAAVLIIGGLLMLWVRRGSRRPTARPGSG